MNEARNGRGIGEEEQHIVAHQDNKKSRPKWKWTALWFSWRNLIDSGRDTSSRHVPFGGCLMAPALVSQESRRVLPQEALQLEVPFCVSICSFLTSWCFPAEANVDSLKPPRLADRRSLLVITAFGRSLALRVNYRFKRRQPLPALRALHGAPIGMADRNVCPTFTPASFTFREIIVGRELNDPLRERRHLFEWCPPQAILRCLRSHFAVFGFYNPHTNIRLFFRKNDRQICLGERNPKTKRVLGERCLCLQDPLEPLEDLCFNRENSAHSRTPDPGWPADSRRRRGLWNSFTPASGLIPRDATFAPYGQMISNQGLFMPENSHLGIFRGFSKTTLRSQLRFDRPYRLDLSQS